MRAPRVGQSQVLHNRCGFDHVKGVPVPYPRVARVMVVESISPQASANILLCHGCVQFHEGLTAGDVEVGGAGEPP